MNNETKESIEFSIGNGEDLKDLLDNISSSHSVEVDCSFEYSSEIDFQLLSQEDLLKTRNKRKGIPEDIM
jgi:hypothetical protein